MRERRSGPADPAAPADPEDRSDPNDPDDALCLLGERCAQAYMQAKRLHSHAMTLLPETGAAASPGAGSVSPTRIT